MTINLTSSGWIDLTGETQTWSDFTDVVFGLTFGAGDAVVVAGGTTVATLDGNDYIAGNAQGSGIGLLVQGELQTNEGADLLVGYSVNGTAGISVSGTIGTGQGNDRIISQAFAPGAAAIEVDASGSILTKVGADVIVGVSALGTGISNAGLIEMDVSGDPGDIDIMQGAGVTGVSNSGSITFGAGNDSLLAVASSFDLVNSGEIRMGSGADTLLLGGSNLMTGGGTVFLGDGGDTFGGFGDMTVDAGNGVNDLLILPTEADFFTSSFGLSYEVGVSGDTVTFTAISSSNIVNGVTMTTTGFETLVYGASGQTYLFNELENGQIIEIDFSIQ